MSRLEHVDATLAQLVTTADAEDLRKVVLLACTTAIDAAGVQDPVVAAAVATLRQGQTFDGASQRELDQRVQDLDEKAWAIEAGDPVDRDGYVRAFRRARAVAAIATASHGPDAGADAIYEAHFAVDDADALTDQLIAEFPPRALDAS